jgi:hypothetical protein
MKSILIIILSLFVLMPPSIIEASAAKKRLDSGAMISRITIRGTNIFDFETMPYMRRFPYSWINGLHIQSKAYVIRH